ncbi:MAG: hypothetical protein PVF74_14730 [Anaerolineales bacterium]|jgi:hypothetical protein
MFFFNRLGNNLTHHLALAYLHPGQRQSFTYFCNVRIEVSVSAKHTGLMVSRLVEFPSW